MVTKHGLSRTTEYKSWLAMVRRCRDPKNASYSRYGARGIDYAPEWESVVTFLRDMGPKPSPAHSLERKDNNKGYCKENCVWALPVQQTRNRSNTRTLSAFGETKTIAEWCAVFKLKYTTLLRRLDDYGMDPETALTTQHRQTVLASNAARKTQVTYQGVTAPLKDLAIKHGVSPALARSRKAWGWSVEEILNGRSKKEQQ